MDGANADRRPKRRHDIEQDTAARALRTMADAVQRSMGSGRCCSSILNVCRGLDTCWRSCQTSTFRVACSVIAFKPSFPAANVTHSIETQRVGCRDNHIRNSYTWRTLTVYSNSRCKHRGSSVRQQKRWSREISISTSCIFRDTSLGKSWQATPLELTQISSVTSHRTAKHRTATRLHL